MVSPFLFCQKGDHHVTRNHFLRRYRIRSEPPSCSVSRSVITMTHNQIVKEQLLHILFGTILFVSLAAIAVLLDLASIYVATLGVSSFTQKALEYTAHGMLVVDLVLFLVYLAASSGQLVKEMTR